MKILTAQKTNVVRDTQEPADTFETIEDVNLAVTALLAMTFPVLLRILIILNRVSASIHMTTRSI